MDSKQPQDGPKPSDPKAEKKEYRYDYFVDKNTKICPENSEFKPTKVTHEVVQQEVKKSDPSLWNSVGIWEEKKFDVEHYRDHVMKNSS